jgi:hypothetical protein
MLLILLHPQLNFGQALAVLLIRDQNATTTTTNTSTSPMSKSATSTPRNSSIAPFFLERADIFEAGDVFLL